MLWYNPRNLFNRVSWFNWASSWKRKRHKVLNYRWVHVGVLLREKRNKKTKSNVKYKENALQVRRRFSRVFLFFFFFLCGAPFVHKWTSHATLSPFDSNDNLLLFIYYVIFLLIHHKVPFPSHFISIDVLSLFCLIFIRPVSGRFQKKTNCRIIYKESWGRFRTVK